MIYTYKKVIIPYPYTDNPVLPIRSIKATDTKVIKTFSTPTKLEMIVEVSGLNPAALKMSFV